MTEPALMRMVSGLIFVILLILVCAWLARRAGLLQRRHGQLLRQLDHLSLGSRGGISVVEIQDTWLVLGVTPGQITVLHTLPASTLTTPEQASFPNLLSRISKVSQPRAS